MEATHRSVEEIISRISDPNLDCSLEDIEAIVAASGPLDTTSQPAEQSTSCRVSPEFAQAMDLIDQVRRGLKRVFGVTGAWGGGGGLRMGVGPARGEGGQSFGILQPGLRNQVIFTFQCFGSPDLHDFSIDETSWILGRFLRLLQF